VQDSGIDPDQIAAIAFDSQMAGIGTVDEEYKPASRFDSWLDMRCQPYIEMIDREAGDLVTRLSGCPPTCDHGPKMLWWKHERPEEYRRVAKFITPAAYVAGTMAGLKADQAFMDYTFIHFSGCSDAQSQTWSAQLCDRLGLDQEKLPEIVEPWRIIGEVKDRAATDFGLSAGTSIAAGAGDTAANALARASFRRDVVRCRRHSGRSAAAPTALSPTRSTLSCRCTRSCRAVNRWPILPVGIALRWFRDQFYWLSAWEPAHDTDLYNQMTASAAGIAPAGLFFSPHLGDDLSCCAMRVRLDQLSWGHPAHFAAAAGERSL
jgi:xylulokinase